MFLHGAPPLPLLAALELALFEELDALLLLLAASELDASLVLALSELAPSVTTPPAPAGHDVCGPMSGADAKTLLAPIENIVVLCMENRSFDHYLGSLKLLEKRPVDGLTGNESNPDPNGVPISSFKLNNFTVTDLPHDWD